MQADEYMARINLGLVQSKLQTAIIGSRIVYLDSVSSTMDVAHSEASNSNNNGLVILAEEQTSGRGRFRRDWISPKYQNLYLSILIRDSQPSLRYMSIAACLAVAKAIERLTPLNVELNWPNDLTIGGKKFAGILVEQVYSTEALSYGIIGIGLNINMDTSVYPEISQTATSIQQETGHPLSRELSLIEILESLEAEQRKLQANLSPVLEWKEKLVTLGKRITLAEAQTMHTGQAIDVDESGNLVMQLDDNSYITMVSGDVTSHPLP